MKIILKFVIVFLISYGLLIYFCSLAPIQKTINNTFRNTSEYIVKSALPKAYIETQDFIDANNKKDPGLFHLVYGNPEIIHAEKKFAETKGLKEYKISTYSFQIYIFHMLTVPLIFLISIFIATPMEMKIKLKSLGISVLLLLGLIYSRCILITLFQIANLKIGIYSLSDSGLFVCFKLVSIFTLGFSIMFACFLWLLFGLRYSPFALQFNNFIKRFQK